MLARLGFSDRPGTDQPALAAVYAAWCRSVPFDNLTKRIHLAARVPSPFPNMRPDVYFGSYLRHGTGGTCWPTAGALHALLRALGFDARRASAAMRDDRTGPVHTHGTVVVRIEGTTALADVGMAMAAPLPLVRGEETSDPDAVSTVRAEPVGDLWRIWWVNPPTGEVIGCLLLADDVDAKHYAARYEASRETSPFNTMLYAARRESDRWLTIARGCRFERTRTGTVSSGPLGDERDRVLVEELGYSEEIVAALPPDEEPPVRSA